VEIIRN